LEFPTAPGISKAKSLVVQYLEKVNNMKQLKFAVAVLVILVGFAASSWAQDQSAQYMQAGNAAYMGRNYDSAISDYLSATQSNPNYWQAYQGLGNCYYAKGDYSTALTNYQKALDINPNNPQLSNFVQSLRAKVSTAPAASNSSVPSPGASTAATSKFELDVNAGLALADSEIGFGGGLTGYIPLDRHFFLGASAAFYTFSVGESGSVSGDGVTETASAGGSVNFIEGLARVKYVLDGDNMQPYFFAGVGIVDASASYSYSSSEEESGGGNLGSQIDPVLALGGGLQFSAGKDMNITVQLKEALVFEPGQTVSETVDGVTESISEGGGTESYTTLEGGLDFNL
jgi:hypothetical protein